MSMDEIKEKYNDYKRKSDENDFPIISLDQFIDDERRRTSKRESRHRRKARDQAGIENEIREEMQKEPRK
jgi:hypothetical protein